MRLWIPKGHGRFAYDIGDLDADEFDDSDREALPDRAPDGVRRRSYDKAFEPAVADGLLTVHAAWARGSRDAYAVGLQHRYELSVELSYEVADNRLPLLDALETLDRQAEGPLPEFKGMRINVLWQWLPIAVVMVGVLFPVVTYGQQLWANQARIGRSVEQLSFAAVSNRRAVPLPEKPVVAPDSGSEVERDEVGRVTRVSAGGPSAVLEEICRLASSSGSCEWMEVRDSEPRHHGLRIGRFAATDNWGEIWTVRIRRTRSSGRWFVGTGLRPLEPIPDDEQLGSPTDRSSPDH